MHKTRAGWKRAQGSAGLPGTLHSLQGPLVELAGRSRPSLRLGASASRICDALTVRTPASSESLAAQTREGLQGNREYINNIWKYQELHAEDCSHHVPHGWKTKEAKANTHCPAFCWKQMWSQTMKMLSNPEEINPFCYLSPPFTLESFLLVHLQRQRFSSPHM